MTRIAQQFIEIEDGPFGNVPRGTHAYARNALVQLGYSKEQAKEVVFKASDNWEIGEFEGPLKGSYKYFDGIAKPLFLISHSLPTHLKLLPDGSLVWDFHLSKYVHGSPALVLNGREATPKMHAFLIRSLTNFMNDEAYNLHKQCCAFFQGGYNDPNGGFFYIEFWNGAKAQPYIEWLNRNAPAFTQ